MSAQSYIKIWTSKPSEHDDVQVFDLLSYDYKFKKTVTKRGEVLGNMEGGDIRITISGFPTNDLFAWMFNPCIQKDGEIIDNAGLIQSGKEHISLKNAECLNFRIHSEENEVQLILDIHADCIDFGDSCYLNKK